MVAPFTGPIAEDCHSVSSMLRHARDGDAEVLGDLLQLYRNYLGVLAASQVQGRLRRRLNPSDIVQETMLAAHRDFAGFRGRREAELLAWLRQILINSVRRAVDTHVKAQKRDLRREVALDAPARANGQDPRLINLLVDRCSTPSEECRRRETSQALQRQLEKLSPDAREVIILRNLQGLPFDEIARRMNRKSGSVRMLWLRAIEKFKATCDASTFSGG